MWQLVGFDYKWEGGVGLGPEDSGMPGLGDAGTWDSGMPGLGTRGLRNGGTGQHGDTRTSGRKVDVINK